MTEPELRAAIAAAPDDDRPREVLADWLVERGDPRGTLIQLDLALHAGRLHGDERAAAVRERAELVVGKRLAPCARARFERGFAEDVRLTSGERLAGEAALVRRVRLFGEGLAPLLDAHRATIELLDVELAGDDELAPLLAAPPPRLRALRLTGRVPALSWENSPLAAAIRAAHEVKLAPLIGLSFAGDTAEDLEILRQVELVHNPPNVISGNPAPPFRGRS